MSAVQHLKLGDIAPIKGADSAALTGPSVWRVDLEHIEPHTGVLLKKAEVPIDEVGQSTNAFDERNVLYSKLRPYLNKVYAPTGAGFATSELVPLHPNPAIVDRNYLAHFLRSRKFMAYASLAVAGAKMPRLSPDKLKNYLVPVPSLPEQRRIAALLDKADALRQKNAEAQCLAADLVPAVFEKMFGKLEETSTFGNFVEIIDYGTNQKAEYDSGEIPVLRMNNVTESGELDLTDIKRADFSPQELASNLLKQGDLLVNRTNSRDLVGKVGIWEQSYRAVSASYFIRVRVNDKKLLPRFAHAALNQPQSKHYFRSKANGAVGQANIGMGTIRSLKIPLPSMAQQEVFVKRQEMVRQIIAKLGSRGQELKALVESVAAEYF